MLRIFPRAAFRSPLLTLALLVAYPVGSGFASPPIEEDEEEGYVVWDEEEPPPLYEPALREGVRPLFGFDFGLGSFRGTCLDCQLVGGLSVGVHGGIQLTPRFAVLADGWQVLHVLATDDQDPGVVTSGMATVASRFWLHPLFWVQTGVGVGMRGNIGGDRDPASFGPAALVAIGGELGHAPRRGIDLQLRLGGTLARMRGSRERMSGERDRLFNLAAVIGYHWN